MSGIVRGTEKFQQRRCNRFAIAVSAFLREEKASGIWMLLNRTNLPQNCDAKGGTRINGTSVATDMYQKFSGCWLPLCPSM